MNHREMLVKKYIGPSDSGIEIGALDKPMNVFGARVEYIDHDEPEKLKQLYVEVSGNRPNHRIDDAQLLTTVPDESINFILTSHVLEHCEDVILTTKNWVRALKRDGIMLTIVPEMTETFDKKRPCTTWQHLVLDYVLGAKVSRFEHHIEYLRHVDNITGQEAVDSALTRTQENTNIHFHAWTQQAQTEMMVNLAEIFDLKIEESIRNGGEVLWVLRKL